MDERRQGFWGYPSDGLHELAERVEGVYEAIQPPSDPMLDFDERDLVRFAEEAGFFPIDLELHAEVRWTDPKPWPTFLNSSGNPKIPTVIFRSRAARPGAQAEQGYRHGSAL